MSFRVGDVLAVAALLAKVVIFFPRHALPVKRVPRWFPFWVCVFFCVLSSGFTRAANALALLFLFFVCHFG